MVEPEHGPPPYQQYDAMPLLPHEDKQQAPLPQADMDAILWDINSHVRDLVVSQYDILGK
jgi:hypothetical protein